MDLLSWKENEKRGGFQMLLWTAKNTILFLGVASLVIHPFSDELFYSLRRLWYISQILILVFWILTKEPSGPSEHEPPNTTDAAGLEPTPPPTLASASRTSSSYDTWFDFFLKPSNSPDISDDLAVDVPPRTSRSLERAPTGYSTWSDVPSSPDHGAWHDAPSSPAPYGYDWFNFPTAPPFDADVAASFSCEYGEERQWPSDQVEEREIAVDTWSARDSAADEWDIHGDEIVPLEPELVTPDEERKSTDETWKALGGGRKKGKKKREESKNDDAEAAGAAAKEKRGGWRTTESLVVCRDELFHRVETFIKNQHENLRLQRQESARRRLSDLRGFIGFN